MLAEFPHRRLAVLRGVADVPDLGSDEVAVAAFERGNDPARVVDAQCRLRDVRDRCVGGNVQRFDLPLVLYQHHGTVDLAERALDLGMAGVADEDEHAALRDVALALVVHFGDQRTGRIEHRQVPASGLVHDALRHAMRAENGDGARRDLGQFLDEDCTLGLEAIDHEFVVNDLVTDVDRRSVLLERTLDDFDGAHHAGAESARLRKKDLHGRAAGTRVDAARTADMSRPSASNTFATIALASSPALAYIAAGLS